MADGTQVYTSVNSVKNTPTNSRLIVDKGKAFFSVDVKSHDLNFDFIAFLKTKNINEVMWYPYVVSVILLPALGTRPRDDLGFRHGFTTNFFKGSNLKRPMLNSVMNSYLKVFKLTSRDSYQKLG